MRSGVANLIYQPWTKLVIEISSLVAAHKLLNTIIYVEAVIIWKSGWIRSIKKAWNLYGFRMIDNQTLYYL